MTKYFIKLTPLAPFFFGGEKTFGDGKNVNYFAKSNPFPQQTTVLGMLRKEILIQGSIYKEKWSEYSVDDKKKMKELIGEKSFQLDSENNFGKIEKLSPVFISDGNENFIRAPLDTGLRFEENEKGRSTLDKSMKCIPFAVGFKVKQVLPNSFISTINSNKMFDEIFSEFIKVGNAKNKAEDENDKFFKQLFYTMRKNYSFAFFADLDFELTSSIVFMGADNSSFRMDVKNTESSFEEMFVNNAEKDKITLLSDALVDEDIYKNCKFALTEVLDFKTIKMEEGRYKKRNSKHEMLKRGSVLFFHEESKRNIEKMLDNKSLQNIGYNIYR